MSQIKIKLLPEMSTNNRMSKPNERWCRILLEKKGHFPPPVTPPPFLGKKFFLDFLKNFQNFFSMKLTVKNFRIFFTMKSAVKNFSIA